MSKKYTQQKYSHSSRNVYLVHAIQSITVHVVSISGAIVGDFKLWGICIDDVNIKTLGTLAYIYIGQ